MVESNAELTWLPAWRIRELVGERSVSPVEVTEHFLGRAEEYDGILHSFRDLDADGAREQARHAEDMVRRGDELGTLHGVPTAVKEHNAVRGLPRLTLGATAGNKDRRTDLDGAPRDSALVGRLRRAGAIIFGTNVMPGMGTVSLLDDEGRQTTDLSFHARNPWDLARVPGSSSAGGCAAVAGGLLPFAIGSDGGGSTRLPAAWSGLLGLHSTMGRVPLGEPASQAWNTSLGPLTRDAKDGALVMQAISGPDGGTVLSIQSAPPDYVGALADGVSGLRFAWSEDFGYTERYADEDSHRIRDAIREAAAGLAGLGGVVETVDRSFDDWTTMLGLGPQGVPPATGEAYVAAEDARRRWWDGLHRIFADHDVLVTPTIQHTAFTIEKWTSAWTDDLLTFAPQWCAYTMPHNMLGWPALSVPCGFVDGLPIGMQLTAPPDGEGLLYRVAQAFLSEFPVLDRHPESVS